MGEELIKEEILELEEIEADVDIQDSESDIETEETVDVVEIESSTDEDIVVEEMAGWVGGDNTKHYSLAGRDEQNQHPIGAITGLRAELDEIERLKPVYSDKTNIANYYEWKDASYDEYGYFVSLVPGTSTIKICDGPDIFGVSVNEAGFIAGQNIIPRGNSYGLIVISGLVDVRCELNVQVGDYVVSNAQGYAKKSGSNYGYKVLATETKNGVAYAVIALGVQSDITDKIGQELLIVDSRLDAAESNIISAVNVANQAYNKSNEISASNQEISDKVDNALETVDKVVSDVEDLGTQISNATSISTQAKAIAESAATSAESMRNEAIESSKEVLAETSKLRDEFALLEEGVTEIEDQISIVVKQTGEQGIAIAGIQTKVSDHDSTINSLTSWQGDTNITMARIEQKADANGAYIQSTVSNMDKYTVGPHSQAYGFTLEQAASILDEGMIYVPTESVTETYNYTDTDGETQIYTRTFTPHYLYMWGKIDGQYRWITVDKNYDATDEVNESSKAIYFVDTFEPVASGNFAYWYTNNSILTGTASTYEPHTLYKWSTYTTKDENGADITQNCWVVVATLAGNSNNRAVSQVKQDANSIEVSVTVLDDKYAGTKIWVDDNKSAIQDTVSWKNENAESIVTFMQEAGDNFASATQVAQIVDKDGNINAASIVTVVNDNASDIYLSADNITMNGNTIFLSPSDVGEDGATAIDGARITTGLISADRIDADNLTVQTANISNYIEVKDDDDNIIFKADVANKNVQMSAAKITGTLTIGQLPETVAETSDIPTKVGDLENDSGFQTKSEVTTITEDTIKTTNVEATNLKVKAANIQDQLTASQINANGISASNVDISGAITATDGKIGGWNITWDGLVSESGTVGIINSDKVGYQFTSLIDGTLTPMSFYAGEFNSSSLETATVTLNASADSTYNYYSEYGTTSYPIDSIWVDTIKDVNGVVITNQVSNLKIDYVKNSTSYSVSFNTSGYGENNYYCTVTMKYNYYVYGQPPVFCVLEDGSAYASKLDISGGNITIADTDSSGFVSISDSGLRAYTGVRSDGYQYQLNLKPFGLVFTYKNSSGNSLVDQFIQIGYYNQHLQIGYKNGLYLGRGNVSSQKLVGSWSADAAISVTSDLNKKNSINIMPESYSTLFDNLRPIIYKYNDGNSGRIHTGFIAQEIDNAISKAGLTTMDFAAVCYDVNEDGDKVDWRVRYEEIIALNTWQIQQLKKRVAELEAKIDELTKQND